MPLKYQGQLNLGNAAFGTEKTITANEVVETAELNFFAKIINKQNMLIPVQVAEDVLENFAQAAAELMAQGYAIQFKRGNDVFLRIYPDIHVKGGNINLARAKELDPTVTELTMENAGALIDKAGVTVRVRAEVEKKFTDLLLQESSGFERRGIVEKPYVERKDGDATTGNQGNQQNTNTNHSGGDAGSSNGNGGEPGGDGNDQN